MVGLLVVILITQLVLLAGLWDVYKRVRAIEDMLAGQKSREASKRLQQVGLDAIRKAEQPRASKKARQSPPTGEKG